MRTSNNGSNNGNASSTTAARNYRHRAAFYYLAFPALGKSLSAGAIATMWRRPLFRLDAGNLYDKYIGESERRLRDALAQVEAMAPMILWIDEIEKGFAGAASHSIDGGLSQRMFGSLLTWMQEHRSDVFVLATANNISALPPELLRKGRFDEIFFVDLPHEKNRRAIWRIHLKQNQYSDEQLALFDLDQLAAASAGYSGAEIAAAIRSARYACLAEDAQLTDLILLDALRHAPPLSVTMSEQIAALRQWASTRAVPVDAPATEQRSSRRCR